MVDMDDNFTKNLKTLIKYSSGGITSKVLFKDDRDNVTLFCMAKGTDMSEHTSTMEGTIYVIEGKGVFTLEGKDIDMIPETLILMKKNAKHSIRAKSDTAFLLSLHK